MTCELAIGNFADGVTRSALRRTYSLVRPDRDLSAGAEAQLVTDVLQMRIDGSFGDAEPTGDLAVGKAFGDQAGDLNLAVAQPHRSVGTIA